MVRPLAMCVVETVSAESSPLWRWRSMAANGIVDSTRHREDAPQVGLHELLDA